MRILKHLIFFFILCALFPTFLNATNGEFWIQYDNFGSGEIHVHIQSIGHTWDWNGSTVTVGLQFDSLKTLNSSQVMRGWDAPTDNNGYGVIPWGLYKVSTHMSISGFREFYIDLRDQGWCRDTLRYKGADFYIHFDESNGSLWIEVKRDEPLEDTTFIIQNYSTINIWNIFEAGNPKTENFLLDVYLANIVQTSTGDNIAGGSLNFNGINYNSNIIAQIAFAQSDRQIYCIV